MPQEAFDACVHPPGGPAWNAVGLNVSDCRCVCHFDSANMSLRA